MAEVRVFQPNRILSSSTTGNMLDGIQQDLDAGNTHILIDLRDVMFMDSSGLAALVIALKRVRAANGRLAVCNLIGQARMVVEMSGMESVFEIYESREQFAQAIAGQ